MSRMQKRTGATALVEGLVKAGVEVIFGYPGGNVLDVFDAVRSAKLRFVLGRHEQGCVHMADGYARTLGRPGVVLVTSGPGLTNTITGLGCANMDGVPMVLVCGQVPLDEIGTDAFQEADTVGLTRAVSKHNFLVKSADEIPETIAQAFYIATHGKPGPVVIDVPRDCQRAVCTAKHPERVCLRAYHPESYATPREVNRLAKLLNEAKRPLIYAGGGVIAADASADVVALAKKAEIPVATTMTGIGSIDEREPLALGMSGIYGTERANRAIAEADVILALGVRFNDRTTGAAKKFAPKAKIVHVDCDASSINKNLTVDLGIVADVKELLTTVNSRIHPARHEEWVEALSSHATGMSRPLWEAQQRGRDIPVAYHSVAQQRGRDISVACDKKSAIRFPLDVIVATDVGEHQLWAVHNIPHVYPRHFLVSGGMGAMGFGIPAAIGAAIARPDHPVVALVGDGGAQMTAEELIVAVQEKLAVTFVVFVNRTLGLVRQMQKDDFGGRYMATDLLCPDFVQLARSYGLSGVRVKGLAGLDAALSKSMRAKRPTLLEVTL